MKEKIFRLLASPLGLFFALFKSVNDSSRDIINKLKFPECIITSGSCITPDSKLGKKVFIDNSIINHCIIGNYTMIHMNARLENVTIGNYCSIAHNVMIGLGEHPIDKFSTSSFFYNSDLNVLSDGFNRFKPVIVGHDVWIGAAVIVLNGVKIGNGAIVAAGAVVTKDIPEYAIVVGIPAKVIRYRNKDTFKKAIDDKWWNLNFEDIELKKYSF